MAAKPLHVFFAAGPGNVIAAHKSWRSNHDDETQMSVTFSSEFASACRQLGANAYIVASAAPADIYRDHEFIIEHRPKADARGIRYHISELLYGIALVKTAVRFKSEYAVLQSGSTHYFVMALFRLFGIKVIPVMHNTLWPAGFFPKSIVARAVLLLDALFFRWVATAVLCVSPECMRQVDKISDGRHGDLLLFHPQYKSIYFRPHSPPPFSPLRLLFAGRITRNKGVFDLHQIMQQLESRLPGCTTLTICGTGPDLDSLRSQSRQMGLDTIVSIRGRTDPTELRKLIANSHIVIVPTRSDFAEGLAMTAVEAILMGRPVITSPVVPAFEVLQPACIVAQTDDVLSYVNAVSELIENPAMYQRLAAACVPLQAMFYDRSKSSESMLISVVRKSE